MNGVKTTELSVHSKENRQNPGHLKTKEDNEDPQDKKDLSNHTTRKQPSTNVSKKVLQFRLQQRRTGKQLADQGIMPLNHGTLPKQEDSYAFEEDSSSDSLSPEQPHSDSLSPEQPHSDSLSPEQPHSDSLSPEQPHSDESQGSACPSSEAMGSTPSSSPALTRPRQGCQNRDPSDQSQEDGLSAANDRQSTAPPAVVNSKTPDKNRHKKPKDVKPKVKKLKYHQYIPPDQKAEKSPPPMDSAYTRLLQQQQLFLQLQILSQQKHAHTHSHTHSQYTHSQHAQHTHQHSFNYQPLHQPALAQKQSSQQLMVCSSSFPTNTVNSSSLSSVKTTYSGQTNVSPVKPAPLPPNLDDLKVSELRQQLRIRGMPVSGTKMALIERLCPFKDHTSSPSHSGSNDISTATFPVTPTGSLSSYQSPSSSSTLSQGGYYPYPSTSSTPPISPASSDLSLSGSLPDSFSGMPMSSSPLFCIQPSPGHLSAEEGQGGGGLSGVGLQGGEVGGMEREKEKILVEKQKVIEELTWKLHQEQRQVEELKMQLHKRKRCHGATQEGLLAPSQLHHLPLQQSPSLMGQHFFGVTVKQEPMSLSSSCPFSSPKHLKSPPGSCMEGMGHCGASLPSMGDPGGPRCLDQTPSSGSPSGMCAFLSPQCSPEDSPITKTSNSPQPSSPNNPYLLSLPLGRDGCSHPLNQATTRPCNMQQLTRSQQMDELLDVLIESGEIPANAREERERSSVTKVVPHITVSPGTTDLADPKFHRRHYEHLSPSQLNYDHTVNHIADSHLETLLGSPLGRGGEVALLKMAAEESGQGEEGDIGLEGYPGPNHHHQDKLLSNRGLVETPTPPSPIHSKVTSVAEVQGLVGMTFSESPWETMEWLDLTPPSLATGFSSVPPTGSSIFNTEFLDVTDINLNTAMDLHLEHW
ncbi:myocardin-like isoform 7-T8 [Salvelinus alpinus]